VGDILLLIPSFGGLRKLGLALLGSFMMRTGVWRVTPPCSVGGLQENYANLHIVFNSSMDQSQY